MKDEDIEKIAQRVAKLVLDNLPEMSIEVFDDSIDWDFTVDDEQEPSQKLQDELFRLTAALELNLNDENYIKCAELQLKIVKIEDKLKEYLK